MSKSYKQTKQDYFDRKSQELRSEGKGVDYGRLNREWSKSDERMDNMFGDIPDTGPTPYESNHQDYDDVG